MSIFNETIIAGGHDYVVADLREDQLSDSVYVVYGCMDIVESVSQSLCVIKKERDAVVDYIESNPLKYKEGDDGEPEFGSEWYEIYLYNVS
jgi:hypothetical protein